jgi:excisionase family DNA binding protein
LKAADAAKILNISKSMTYQMMQRGEIPTVRLGGSVRVRFEDLEQYIENNTKSKEDNLFS